MGTIILIILAVAIIAFPNATETIFAKGGEIFMSILTPIIEHLAQILQ